MRKISIFLLLVLAASLLITSCQAHKDHTELYAVLINEEAHNSNNIDASKYDKFSMSGKRYNNSNISEEKTERILNNTYTLSYLYSISSSIYGDNLDYYYDSALDCKIAYSTATGKLSRITSQNLTGRILSYDDSLLNADAYLLWLESIVENTFAISLDSYNIDCRTYYTNGAVDNSFVCPTTDMDNQVDFYYFEYTKRIGQYKSAEAVKLIAHPDGGLKSIIHSEIPCVSLTNISVDETKLNQTIEKTVNDVCSEKYTMKNYTVKSMVLQYYEGEPYMMCGVEITSIDPVGDDVGCSIILAIDLESPK